MCSSNGSEMPCIKGSPPSGALTPTAVESFKSALSRRISVQLVSATLAANEALPRHHVRVPDERARLRADEGDARVARLRGGRHPRRLGPHPLQHVLPPRVR